MSDKLLTVKEAAEYLNINRWTLYRWARQGKIAYFKAGGSIRFHKDKLGQEQEATNASSPK